MKEREQTPGRDLLSGEKLRLTVPQSQLTGMAGSLVVEVEARVCCTLSDSRLDLHRPDL